MGDRRKATATTAGILRPEEFGRRVHLDRRAASPAVARWVENHWLLTWDLPAATRFPSQVLAHPTCNLTVERGHPRAGVGDRRVLLTGVATTRFDVEAQDRGWVWGVRFRPGGLAALTGLVAADLTDATVPAADLLPAAVVGELDALRAGTPPAEAAARVEGALLGLVGAGPDGAAHDPAADTATDTTDRAADAGYDTVLAVVGAMLGDRSLVRVAQVEERCGIGRRRLERLFARYVGVGPKWVLARYRLHDVVTALDQGYAGSLADLAAAHGWYDQAHFARDFGTLVGVTPSDYRRGAPTTGT